MEQDGIFPKSNRRTVIAGAAAVAAAGVVMTNASRAAAQDATAEATAASTLPMVPAEFEVETNWPVENLDMSNTRNVKGSSIDSSNVTSLTEAWSVPITAEGAYGNLTGNPAVGQTLTANPGAWTEGTTFTYLWYADGKEIAGQTGPTLTLTASEKGRKIWVTAIGSIPGYTTATKTSAPTGKVT